MANITGRQTVNNIHILEVDANPDAGLGAPAPIGSIASVSDGYGVFLKTGSGNSAWSLLASTGGGSGSANQLLSNLTGTAVNTSLLPGINSTYSIGSSSFHWSDGYFTGLLSTDGYVRSTGIRFTDGSVMTTAASGTGGGGSTSPSGSSGAVQFNSSGSFGADVINFFWDNTNKRLGIGTNSPANRIDARSSTGGTTISASDTTATGDTYIQAINDGFGTAYIALQASGSAQAGIFGAGLAASNIAKANSARIEWGSGVSTALLRCAANIPMVFATNDTERLRISGSGNIGVNTTTPNEKLTIGGIISVAETTTPTNTSGFGKIYPKNDGYLYFLNGSNTEYNLMASGGGGSSAAGSDGYVQFKQTGVLAADPGLVWDNTSKFLGVGTSVPVSKLHVAANGTAAAPAVTLGSTPDSDTGWYHPDADTQAWSVGGEEMFRITTSQASIGAPIPANYAFNVDDDGIGTYTASSIAAQPAILAMERSRGTLTARTALSAGDEIGSLRFRGFTDDGYTSAEIKTIAATGWGSSGSDSPGHMLLMTTDDGYGTATERVRITSAGRVGVNTQTPTSTFHVDGSTSKAITTVTVNTTLNADHYTVLVNANTGNVTITLPSASLRTGRIYNVMKIDSSGNTVTVDGSGSETINGSLTQVLTAIYEGIMIQCDGSAWYVI